MQVLLTTLNAKYIHNNLAVRILYQLNKHREGLAWKEFTIKQDRTTVAEFCSRFQLVAFSCYIWNIRQTLEVCKLIKEINPDIKILLGGPEVSYEYETVIAKTEIDFIIAGEGETAFSEFLDNYPRIENVPGLIWKSAGQTHANPTPPAFDLQKLAGIMPYADDPVEELRNKVLYIETSRGCPYKCEFCLASLDNKVRYLPLSSIHSTLLHLMEHGRVIKFLDRTFNIKKDFTLGIFSFILEHHRPGNVFQFEITADILPPDIIKFVRENVPEGLFRFEIGIQTINREANLAVSRKQDFSKTRQIILQLKDHVEMHLDLIVGLPLEGFSEIRRSFEEVFSLHPPELQLGFLKFLKGTPVREKYGQHGYVFHDEAPYEIIRSNYLSEAELQDIRDLEEGLEIYWNGKKAIRSLRYVENRYSIFDFLMLLGKRFKALAGGKQYSLTDVYDEIHSFALSNYPKDKILHELIALDYYLYNNRRPAIRYLQPLNLKERGRLKFNLSFDPGSMNADISEGEFTAVVHYTENEKPRLTIENVKNSLEGSLYI
jgi:anaerobic magnesium-protoporphyrin IX monomethyl ester cyclase